MVAIVDYRAGNLTSVFYALTYLGYKAIITSKLKKIMAAERIIFPGVGAAGKAMVDIRKLGLDKAIKEVFNAGKPILGICLGIQIIFERSEENNTHCLGIISGEAKAFPHPLYGQTSELLKIPHMGWNKVKFVKSHPVFNGLDPRAEFYFLHSYYPVPKDALMAFGLTEYGIEFTSALAYENLIAIQFHPEKSGRPGLKILENFCNWSP